MQTRKLLAVLLILSSALLFSCTLSPPAPLPSPSEPPALQTEEPVAVSEAPQTILKALAKHESKYISFTTYTPPKGFFMTSTPSAVFQQTFVKDENTYISTDESEEEYDIFYTSKDEYIEALQENPAIDSTNTTVEVFEQTLINDYYTVHLLVRTKDDAGDMYAEFYYVNAGHTYTIACGYRASDTQTKKAFAESIKNNFFVDGLFFVDMHGIAFPLGSHWYAPMHEDDQLSFYYEIGGQFVCALNLETYQAEKESYDEKSATALFDIIAENANTFLTKTMDIPRGALISGLFKEEKDGVFSKVYGNNSLTGETLVYIYELLYEGKVYVLSFISSPYAGAEGMTIAKEVIAGIKFVDSVHFVG